MSANTPKAGLTYPSLADVPNVPSNMQTMAGQLDNVVIPKYASSSAQTTANPTPTKGDLCYRTDLSGFQYYDGSAWETIVPGAWQTYSPSWGSSGTAPTIGNGSITGRYMIFGKTVTFNIVIQFGSTTNFGTGAYSFGLPFTTITRTGAQWPGAAFAVNVGTAVYPGTVYLTSNATAAGVYSPTGAGGSSNAQWGNTVPFTFAATSNISLQGTYEIP